MNRWRHELIDGCPRSEALSSFQNWLHNRPKYGRFNGSWHL